MSFEATPLSTFSLFPSLPREIRFMIWKAVLPGPRIINIREKRLAGGFCERVWSDKDVNNEESNAAFFLKSEWQAGRFPPLRRRAKGDAQPYSASRNPLYGIAGPAAPTTLSVCWESYEVTCTEYKRVLGTTGALAGIWLNPKDDDLFLDCRWLNRHQLLQTSLAAADLSLVERLTLDAGHVNIVDSWCDFQLVLDDIEIAISVCDVLSLFGNVKVLTLACDCAPRGWSSDDTELSYLNFFDHRAVHTSSYAYKVWPFDDPIFQQSREDMDALAERKQAEVFERLDAMRKRDIASGIERKWKTPIVLGRIIATSQGMRDFERRLEAHENEHLLQRQVEQEFQYAAYGNGQGLKVLDDGTGVLPHSMFE